MPDSTFVIAEYSNRRMCIGLLNVYILSLGDLMQHETVETLELLAEQPDTEFVPLFELVKRIVTLFDEKQSWKAGESEAA